MHQIPFFSTLLISLLTLSITHPSSQQQQCSSPAAVPVRAGYWLSQSNHYSPASLINTSLYTHIYCSVAIDETNSHVSLTPTNILPILTTFSSTIKASNSSLKTLLSITVDNSRSDASNTAFSFMATDPTLRAAFINSTIQLARANAFDGLDLAWQFPSSSPNMANFGVLLAEWRARMNEEVREQPSLTPLLLTATVYFSNHLFDGATDDDVYYPIDALTSNLDWINALCFGYQDGSGVTAADAALYNKVSHFSTSYGITSWLDAGVPPCKLVMGIPLYGRSWFLKNKEKNGLSAPVVAAGPREKLSNQTGVMAYFEIKELLKDSSSVSAYDNNTVSSYFHSGGLWVSYDSPEVVQAKIEFVVRNKLLGYFLWPISFDDANHTVSKQALDDWLRYQDSGAEGEIVSEEALSPAELPPQDDAQISTAVFIGLRRGFSTTNIFCLHSCILLFLLV